MRDKLCTLLGIETVEGSKISMLLTQSVFLGIFIGAFDIAAYSLLLSTFDEKFMARGYVLSGLTGIIITSLFLRFRKKMNFSNFYVISLVIVALITIILWLLLNFYLRKWIIFMVFVMAGPLNILTLFGFWAMSERLFSQRIKLLSLLDSGILGGVAFISFLIPVLIALKLSSHNILLFGAASVLIAMLIQRAINKQLPLFRVEKSDSGESTKDLSFISVIRREKFYLYLSFYAALSVLTAFIVQYLFMTVTRKQFPAAEEMASFLGLFTGCMMVTTELTKRIAFPTIIRQFSVGICLIIPPVLIAFISLISIICGLSMGYAYISAAGFIIFFILLIFNRLVSKSLKESFEIQSFKVIYQSINTKIRSELKNGFTYTLNEAGVLLSGVILSGFGFLSFMKIIHFSALLLVVSLIWLYFAYRLFKEYPKAIFKSLENGLPESSEKTEHSTLKNRFAGQLLFKTNYFNLISGDYIFFNSITNKWYFEEIINYAQSKNDYNLIPVLKKAAVNGELDKNLRQRSASVIGLLLENSKAHGSNNDRISQGMKILAETRLPQTTEILRLLRDNSLESKRLAVYLIGKFRIADLLSVVCESMNSPGLAKDAFVVLESFGPSVEDELIRYYLITSGNVKLSKSILQLLGKTCSRETMSFLFSRLWSNSRSLKEIIASSLVKCGFTPSDEQKYRLDQLSSEVIGFIAWYMSARIILMKSNDKFLVENITKEIERWNNFLFDILAITYDPVIVKKIRENIDNDSVEGIGYALEMIDLMVSDSIKSKLASLFAIASDKRKVKELFEYFPEVTNGRHSLLEDIINRDYNLISLWTKACTLRTISSIDGDEDLANSVIAMLFSPEELIQEEALNLIKRSDKKYFYSVSGRIQESVKKKLDNILIGGTRKEELLFEKINFLSKHFSGIPEDDLLPLAGELKFTDKYDPEFFNTANGCIIWPLRAGIGGDEAHVLYDGEAERYTGKLMSEPGISFYVLTLTAIEEYHFQFPGISSEVLKYIDELQGNA